MAVLKPEHDSLAGAGRGEAGIAVCGPSVRVMSGGERAVGIGTITAGDLGAGIAEYVEGVFDDVVPGRSDDVEKQLTAEFGEAEAVADFAAIQDDRAPSRSTAFAPFGEDLTITGEQRHPAGNSIRAVTRPVIRGHEPRMQSVCLTEKSKIGGEIERVEISVAIGQTLGR